MIENVIFRINADVNNAIRNWNKFSNVVNHTVKKQNDAQQALDNIANTEGEDQARVLKQIANAKALEAAALRRKYQLSTAAVPGSNSRQAVIENQTLNKMQRAYANEIRRIEESTLQPHEKKVALAQAEADYNAKILRIKERLERKQQILTKAAERERAANAKKEAREVNNVAKAEAKQKAQAAKQAAQAKRQLKTFLADVTGLAFLKANNIVTGVFKSGLMTMRRMLVSTVRSGMRLFTGMFRFGKSITSSLGMLRYGISSLRTALDPLTRVFGSAFKGVTDFDEAISQSTAIMTDDAKVTERMKKEAIDLSTELRQSATELAQTYYVLGSAGYTAEQSMKALPIVAKFATAAIMDTKEATRLLTQTQYAMGLNADDATKNMNNLLHVANVLTKAETLAQGTLKELTTSLAHDAAASAKIAGYSLEQITAGLTALSNRGMSGALAGNMIGRMLRLLAQAASGNAEVFKELGINVFDATGNLLPLQDVLRSMNKAMSELSLKGKTQAFEAMGFRVLSQKAIGQLLSAGDVVEEHMNKLSKTTGSLETIWSRHMRSFNAQVDLMKNNIMAVSIEMTQMLLPFLREVVHVVMNSAKAFRELNPTLKQTILIVSGITLALGALFTTGAVMTTIFGFLFGPMGLLVAGVAAASVLTGVWIAKWVRDNGGLEKSLKKVSDWLKDVWKRTELLRYVFADVFSKGYKAVERFTVQAGRAINNWLRGFTGDTFDTVDNFETAMTKIILFAEWAAQSSERFWTIAAQGAAYAFIKSINEIIKAVGSVVPTVSNAGARIKLIFLSLGVTIMTGMYKSIHFVGIVVAELFVMLGTAIADMWNSVKTGKAPDFTKTFKEGLDRLGRVGEKMILDTYRPLAASMNIGLADGLKETESKLIDSLKATISGATRPTKEQLSKEYEQLIQEVTKEGTIKGFFLKPDTSKTNAERVEFLKKELESWKFYIEAKKKLWKDSPKPDTDEFVLRAEIVRRAERSIRGIEELLTKATISKEEFFKKRLEGKEEGFFEFYERRMNELTRKHEFSKWWSGFLKETEDIVKKGMADPFEKPKDEMEKGSKDYEKTIKESMRRVDAALYDSAEGQHRVYEYLDRLQQKAVMKRNMNRVGDNTPDGRNLVPPVPRKVSMTLEHKIDGPMTREVQVATLLDDIRRLNNDQLEVLKNLTRRPGPMPAGLT